MYVSQKMASDLLFLEFEPVTGCWELNPGLLEEQVLLLSEPSLQPHHCSFL